MNENELRVFCRERLHRLGLRPPIEVRELCRRLGDEQGRPIELLAEDLPDSAAFGFLTGDETCDVIVYQNRTSPAHQTHIILHEIGHILCQHPRKEVDQDYRQEDFPGISEEMLRFVLGRTLYSELPEWEAETIATIMAPWVRPISDTPGPTSTRGSLATRLHAVLGDKDW